MFSRKTWVVLGLLLAAICIIGIYPTLQSLLPAAPTPAPTKPPFTVINGWGGQIFLADSDVRQRLLDEYNVRVDFKAVGSSDMVNGELKGLDFVWPGSAVTYDEFTEAKKGAEKKHSTIFRTYTMIFGWTKYRNALLRTGLVYEKESAYYMKMAPVIKAMNEGKKWAEIGLTELPGFVNISFTDPERSGGGLTCLTLFANYQVPGGENGGKVVTRAQLDPNLPSLLKIWENQGRQDKASPEGFDAWLQRGSGVPLNCSSESLYLGWRKNAAKSDVDLVFGIYPEWTISSDHTLVGLTANGARLVDIFTIDKELQQIGWRNLGMRTKAGGVSAKAGDTDVTWISGDPNFTAEVTTDVSMAIREAIKSYRTK
jgi:hypothetical protein